MSPVGHNIAHNISHFLLEVLRGRYSKLPFYLESQTNYCKLIILRIKSQKNHV